MSASLNPIASVVTGILEPLLRFIPDPNERARIAAETTNRLLEAYVSQDAGQVEINKAEAATGNMFVGGWRPAIGWVCAAAIAWAFVVGPALRWGLIASGQSAAGLPPTVIDSSLWELVLGMLGLAGLRTFEKVRQAAR